MPTPQRDPVVVELSDMEHRALVDWRKQEPAKVIGQQCKVDRKYVGKWVKTRRVPRSVYIETLAPLLRARLGQKSGEKSADPAHEIKALFERGRKLHYEQYSTDQAMLVLQHLQFHPHLHLLPITDSLEMLSVTMAVFRQCTHASESNFLSCGHKCLELICQNGAKGSREELSALIYTVAWELVATTVQRGGAAEAIPILETIDRHLRDKMLIELLKPGRENSMVRLLHWGSVVAYQNFDDVKRDLKARVGKLDSHTEKTHRPVELHNIYQQKLAERLRFSAADPCFEAQGEVDEFYQLHIQPVFKDISAIRKLRQSETISPSISSVLTPSTAFAVAFTSVAVNLQLMPEKVAQFIQEPLELGKQIARLGDGAIVLYYMNPETERLIRRAKLDDTLKKEILATFPRVANFSESGKMKLRALACQLIDEAERCLTRK